MGRTVAATNVEASRCQWDVSVPRLVMDHSAFDAQRRAIGDFPPRGELILDTVLHAWLITFGSHLARDASHQRAGSVLAPLPKITTGNGGGVPYPTAKHEHEELDAAVSTMLLAMSFHPFGPGWFLMYSFVFSALTCAPSISEKVYRHHYDYSPHKEQEGSEATIIDKL